MPTLRLSALFVACFITACSPSPSGPSIPGAPSHHLTDGFRNIHIDDPKKSFFDFLFMKFFSDTEWADHEARAGEVPIQDIDLAKLAAPGPGVQITWLGHSTFLIQIDGRTILTDPIFGERASPLPFTGPKRYVPHVIDYQRLPPIDYVIISHNHYDHLDEAALEILGNGPLYLVPLRLKSWFVEQGIDDNRIREFDWWDNADLPDLSVQAMPSQHWSARSLFDRRKTLWATWLMEIGGKRLWFAGDTGYNDIQFKEIGRAAPGIDLALIPIGGYAPRWFMKAYHVDPDEAVKIHRDIGAKASIGMHWGTFPMTAEGPIDPVIVLEKSIAAHNLAPGEFTTMVMGETIIRN